MSGRDELRRALRDANADEPASLERLLAALHRIGVSGVVRHHELLGLEPDGVVMMRGRIFEALTEDGPVRFRVARSLGYGVAFGPSGIWAEAELVESTLGNYVVREKVRSTGNHGGALELSFAVVDTLDALRARCREHGRSARLHIGTLYDAMETALGFALEDPHADPPVAWDWDRARDC